MKRKGLVHLCAVMCLMTLMTGCGESTVQSEAQSSVSAAETEETEASQGAEGQKPDQMPAGGKGPDREAPDRENPDMGEMLILKVTSTEADTITGLKGEMPDREAPQPPQDGEKPDGEAPQPPQDNEKPEGERPSHGKGGGRGGADRFQLTFSDESVSVALNDQTVIVKESSMKPKEKNDSQDALSDESKGLVQEEFTQEELTLEDIENGSVLEILLDENGDAKFIIVRNEFNEGES